MTIVDGRLPGPEQTRHLVLLLARIMNRHRLVVDIDIDLLADQSRRHRVAILFHRDQRATVYQAAQSLLCFQPLRRQRRQSLLLLVEPRSTRPITLRQQLAQKALVVAAVGKRVGTTQQQRLLQGRLEMAVRGFGIAVLVR